MLHVFCANSNRSAVVFRILLLSLHSDARPFYQWEDALVLRKVRNGLLLQSTEKKSDILKVYHIHIDAPAIVWNEVI